MAQQFQVQSGDTVSSIAKRFNVPTSAVSGFRSNDPNTIFPDEILTIDDSQSLTPQTPQDPQAGAQQQQTPFTPVAPSLDINAPQQPLVPVQDPSQEAQPQAQPVAPVVEQPAAPTPAPEAPAVETTAPTPEAPEVTIEEEAPVDEATQQAQNLFGQFGISTDAVEQGFQANPFGTLSELVTQVMEATGLPDLRDSITSTANQIEELELQRDAAIQEQQDDPFQSAGTKARKAEQIRDKFDKRINARINKLTLLQSSQKEARQQAQFAATTAINLFDKQQQIQQDQLDRVLDERERVLEAQRAEGALTTETIDGFTVLRDPTGKIVSTVKPETTSGQLATGKELSGNILKVRSAIRQEPAFKNFVDILNAYENTKVGFDLDNAAGDLAIVNGIAKILDPGSVIRPSEFETVKEAQGFFEQVANLPFKVASGRIAGADARERLLGLAEELVVQKGSPLRSNLESSFEPVADGLGVDFGEAVPEIAQLEGLQEEIDERRGPQEEELKKTTEERSFFGGLKTFLFGE